MLPPMAAPSAPTLPFTRRDLEGLPDFSAADDEEGETHVMPTQGMPLSTVGERPVAEPRVVEALESTHLVDDVELVAIERDVADALAKESCSALPRGPSVVTDTLCSFEPELPPKKRHPPVRVWAAVILVGAALGIVGGTLVAKATAPIPPLATVAPVTPFVVVPAVGSDVPLAKGADANGSLVPSASITTSSSIESAPAVVESGASVESSKVKATRRTPSPPRRPPSKKSGKTPSLSGVSGLFDSAIQ